MANHEILHTPAYGSDIWSLIGKGFSKGFTESEARRIAREALERNLSTYIRSVGTIEVQKVRGKMMLRIPVTTIYSKKEVAMDVGL